MKNLLSPMHNYFCKAAELRSIRHASEHLHVSASAINRQIINLEQQLGIALFERMPRGVRLTEAGKILYETIRAFENQSAACIARIRSGNFEFAEKISIGVLQTMGEELMPVVAADLKNMNTGVGLDIRVATTGEIISDVLSGKLDLGLCWRPHFQIPIDVISSHVMLIGVIMAPGHVLAQKTSLSIDECMRYPCILPSSDMEFRSVVDRLFGFRTPSLRSVAECNSVSVIKGLVSKGLGLAFVMEFSARKEIASGELIYRQLALTSEQTMELVLFKRRGKNSSDGLNRLMDQLRSHLQILNE
jgi:DNA-binding transcriptional LysR family regulator